MHTHMRMENSSMHECDMVPFASKVDRSESGKEPTCTLNTNTDMDRNANADRDNLHMYA